MIFLEAIAGLLITSFGFVLLGNWWGGILAFLAILFFFKRPGMVLGGVLSMVSFALTVGR